MSGLVCDLFCGGGGASTGIEAALGRPVDIAINHSPVAIAVHEANHGATKHLTTDVFDVNPLQATQGRAVDLCWFSPDCTHFSRAKGSRPDRPRSRKIRSLAWVVVRWARTVRPRVMICENVVEFLTWGPLDKNGQPVARRIGRTFREWCRQLERLGYVVDWKELDASRYGAPTRRKRLFIVARCDGQPIRWPAPTHGPGLIPYRTAGECIDWSIPTRSIFGRKKPLAAKTLHRIAEGIRRFVLENPSPYIVRVNHGRDDHRGQTLAEVALVDMQRENAPRALDEPLGTLTTQGNRFNLLRAAFVARHFGGMVGDPADKPIATVTARDHHSPVAAALIKFRGECHGASLDEPMPAITAQGLHLAECRAFLTKFYSAKGTKGASLFDAMPTATAKARFGLVVVDGVEYEIGDIFLRMLEPAELLRAQFGEFAEGYDLSAAHTKESKTRLVGNSVCPHVAAALVRANLVECQVAETAS